MSKFDYDVVIVGAGVFGLSTALSLVQNTPQYRVALIERSQIGHDQGGSHSRVRMMRSVYRSHFYRDLSIMARTEHWPQIEALLGKTLLKPTKYVHCNEHQSTFKQIQESVAESKSHIEFVSSQETKKRFPALPFVKSKFPNVIDNDAALILAEEYLQSSAGFLRKQKSIDLLEDHQLMQFLNDQHGATLTIKNKGLFRIVRCKKVVLTCGRWTNQLVPEMKDLVREIRQTASIWQMRHPDQFSIEDYPLWLHTNTEGKTYYSMPDQQGMKFGLRNNDPDLYHKLGGEQSYLAYVRHLYTQKAQQYFGQEAVRVKNYERCYYAMNRNQEFLIDWSDQYSNVLIVSTCCGNGFKFGPTVGKIVTDLLNKDTSFELFEKYRHICRLSYHTGVHL